MPLELGAPGGDVSGLKGMDERKKVLEVVLLEQVEGEQSAKEEVYWCESDKN